MTGLLVLGFLVCLGACYIGARLFYGAMHDAVMHAEARKEAVLKAAMGDLQRRQLREQSARAHASDGLLQAIAEYEANELARRR